MRRRRHVWVLLAAVKAAGLSCTAEPTPRRWEGQFVTLTSSEGIEPCGGMLPFLDRFVAYNYGYWTEDTPPRGLHFEFDLRTDISGDDFSGKASFDTGTAWADAQYAVLHELTHLVVGAADGNSAPMLSEGIAEALGPSNLDQWNPLHYEPQDYVFLTRDEFSGVHYQGSAQLIRFWIDRYGVETVRAAYIAARFDHSSEEIERALVTVFGNDLYDGLTEFAEGPQCPLQAWECGDAVLPVHTLPITVEPMADCRADTSSLGAIVDGDDQWYPKQQFVLELTEETSFLIETHDNASVRLTACVETCGQTPPHLRTVLSDKYNSLGQTTFERTRPAGRYIVTVRPLDISHSYSASLRVLP